MNKKLIAPIVTIAATFAMAVGTTYAMFTRNVSKTVDVTSGKIDVSIDMTMSEALSRYLDEPPFDAMANAVTLGGDHEAVFELTGTGDLESETLTLDRIAPTDQVTTKVSVTNASNISIKWRYGIQLSGELIPALDIKLGDQVIDTSVTDTTIYQPWSEAIEPSVTELIPETNFVVTFPDDVDNNDYQGKTGQIKFLVETVQGNMEVHDPAVTKYGFADSYLVDEGLETEHWVHEIASAEDFRNIMDTSEHDSKHGQFDYPGAGEKETVYLITQDIDFGGSIYTPEQIEEVKSKNFTGILRGVEGVTLSNVHLTEVMSSSTTTNNAIWGLFDGVLNASFESFTLSDFTINNSSGKVCGLLATGQEKKNVPDSEGFDNTAYLKVKDVVVLEDCYVNVNANAGALFGNARNLDRIELDNCINNADVTIGSGSGNVGGFIGSASFDSLKIGNTKFATNSIEVNNCTNNGKIESGSSGYASSLIGYNLHSGTISNYTNNGVINFVGNGSKSNVGVASGQSPAMQRNRESLDDYHSIDYVNVVQNSYIKYMADGAKVPVHTFENKTEYTQVYYTNASGDLVSGFDGVNNLTQEYKTTKLVSGDIMSLLLSFDEDNTLTVAANSLTNVAKMSVSLAIGRHTATPSGYVKNQSATPNYLVYFDEIVSTSGTTEELNAKGLKKVNQLGYFSPNDVNVEFDPTDFPAKRFGKYLEDFHLDSALYGTTGYTDDDLGYGVNSKGGYVLVRDISDAGFTVLTRVHQDPHFTVNAYDDEGKLLATGTVYSGRIVGEHVPEDIHQTAGIDKYVYLG